MEAALQSWVDLLVIALYLVFVLGVGLWAVCRSSKKDVQSYFLAGRLMTWFPVGASLFASNIGSEHFIGLAGTAAASGISIVVYEWMSSPLVLALSWFFLPVYLSAGVYTLPEYLERRFASPALRIYLCCLSLVLYVVTKIAVCIFAGAFFIQLVMGWNLYLAITVLLVITAFYTVLGGLTAVIFTDALQTVVMMLGAFVLAIICFVEVGSYKALQQMYLNPVRNETDVKSLALNASSCSPGPEAFHLFHSAASQDNPWPGLVLQASVGCLWYWCCDQVIVQRALAAKSLIHAKGGAILAGYLKFTPLLLMVYPGMISRALYPDEIGCTDPEHCERQCGNRVGCSNMAYPLLVLRLLPIGVRGLLMAVMLSAIMSSLTSIFNSASSLFTLDLWRKVRVDASEKELLIVGRLFVVLLCALSILWVPLVQSSAGGQLFQYIQAVQGYLGTPIGAVFLLGVFWKKTNSHGALIGLVIGHLVGCTRMILDFVYSGPSCGQMDRPPIVAAVHYTYFGQLNFGLTFVITACVSLLTATSHSNSGATWWSKGAKVGIEEINVAPLHDPVAPEPTENGRKLSAIGDSTLSLKEQISFAETKRANKVVNVNAIISLIIFAFLMGYFA